MSRKRTALVTGAASGIGLASAEFLLRDGVSVILTDRSPEVIAIAADLAKQSRNPKTTGTDLPQQVKRVYPEIVV